MTWTLRYPYRELIPDEQETFDRFDAKLEAARSALNALFAEADSYLEQDDLNDDLLDLMGNELGLLASDVSEVEKDLYSRFSEEDEGDEDEPGGEEQSVGDAAEGPGAGADLAAPHD